jgi:hypothetical protein
LYKKDVYKRIKTFSFYSEPCNLFAGLLSTKTVGLIDALALVSSAPRELTILSHALGIETLVAYCETLSTSLAMVLLLLGSF